jgi:hypothetical protein
MLKGRGPGARCRRFGGPRRAAVGKRGARSACSWGGRSLKMTPALTEAAGGAPEPGSEEQQESTEQQDIERSTN